MRCDTGHRPAYRADAIPGRTKRRDPSLGAEVAVLRALAISGYMKGRMWHPASVKSCVTSHIMRWTWAHVSFLDVGLHRNESKQNNHATNIKPQN